MLKKSKQNAVDFSTPMKETKELCEKLELRTTVLEHVYDSKESWLRSQEQNQNLMERIQRKDKRLKEF